MSYSIQYLDEAAMPVRTSCSANELPFLIAQLAAKGGTLLKVTQMDLQVAEAAQAPGPVPFSMLLGEYTGKRADSLDGLKRVDGIKPRYDLIPALAELEIAKIFTIGAMKYDAGHEDVQNWMHPSRTHRMMFSASRRHQEARRLGELVDEDMKCHHLAAAIVDLMMILEADLRGWTDKDNFDPQCLKRPGTTQLERGAA